MNTDCKDIIDLIRSSARSDERLAGLYEELLEYVRMYSYVKKRQKGCDGLGDLNNLKDELRVVLEKLLAYCRRLGYLDENASYDVERLIEDAAKLSS